MTREISISNIEDKSVWASLPPPLIAILYCKHTITDGQGINGDEITFHEPVDILNFLHAFAFFSKVRVQP